MSILKCVGVQRIEPVHQVLLHSVHLAPELLHLVLWNALRQWAEAELVSQDQDIKDASRLLFTVLELFHAELGSLVVLASIISDTKAHLAEDDIKASLTASILQIGDHVLQHVVALKDVGTVLDLLLIKPEKGMGNVLLSD